MNDFDLISFEDMKIESDKFLCIKFLWNNSHLIYVSEHLSLNYYLFPQSLNSISIPKAYHEIKRKKWAWNLNHFENAEITSIIHENIIFIIWLKVLMALYLLWNGFHFIYHSTLIRNSHSFLFSVFHLILLLIDEQRTISILIPKNKITHGKHQFYNH